MAVRKKSDTERGTRLLDLWTPPPEAGAAVGCVATTFTFDAGHFEEHCLGGFLSMETEPAESPKAYLIEREEKLSEAFACVLADQRHVSAPRSLRWPLLAIRLPGRAIQHSKLSVLLWERHLRILIGSANLTEPGYRSNVEVMVPLEFSPDGGAPIDLALECIDYLERLSEFSPGNPQTDGPRKALAQFLNRARQRVRDWKVHDEPTDIRCALLPLLPTPTGARTSIIERLQQLWHGSAPTKAAIISPFFDQTDGALDILDRKS